MQEEEVKEAGPDHQEAGEVLGEGEVVAPGGSVPPEDTDEEQA